MKYRMNKASNIFLYCFAAFLLIVVIVCVFTKSDYIEMVASIAAIAGVFFTLADLMANNKTNNERILSLITELIDKDKELISLQRTRNKRLQEYCEVKCKQYQECSEDNKNKDVLINSYQKAFNIISTINSAMENMKKEASDSDNTFPKDFRCRYNRNRLYRVGLMHDAFMVIGFMSALGLLCMYNFLEIPSSIPNYLTVLGFGLIILVYASRDRAETMVQEAEEYVKNECKKVDERLLNEQKIIRQINTALCESAEFLKTEADVRLFIFVMQIIEDD